MLRRDGSLRLQPLRAPAGAERVQSRDWTGRFPYLYSTIQRPIWTSCSVAGTDRLPGNIPFDGHARSPAAAYIVEFPRLPMLKARGTSEIADVHRSIEISYRQVAVISPLLDDAIRESGSIDTQLVCW